jgi:feruloyl esterase
MVVLHGCGQSPAAYDHSSGWSKLADRYGFIVLYPEQRPSNNPNGCFSWFSRGHNERDRGEARSIREAIEKVSLDYKIDRERIFITGLSAGGAMTSVMLAAYPEVFAGGAIIAGLPYGVANNVQEAFQSMFQGKTLEAEEWGNLVRAASDHQGPWPRVSIWHGTADAMVKPMNAAESLKQWQDLHGVSEAPPQESLINGHPCLTWHNANGDAVIEHIILQGMAHGTPIDSQTSENSEAAGPYMLDFGISSTVNIARFCGLLHISEVEAAAIIEAEGPQIAETVFLPEPAAAHFERPLQVKLLGIPAPNSTPVAPKSKSPARKVAIDVEAIIIKALRAAGLSK